MSAALRDDIQTAGFSAADHRHMGRALQLARRGLYGTRPNPRVGCVLVQGDRVVGEGWHQRCGEAHAEVHAIAAAGSQARGATAYVTLEPCSHHGLTPPCADALLSAGVGRVVAATADPNPRVSGAGLARLGDAGVRVGLGLLAAGAQALNPGFFTRMRRGRPWVRLKLAASLDGRTALGNGISRWITGADARRDVHAWRAGSCAILTGIETVLADDPGLTVRDHPALQQMPGQPLRVVLDSRLRLPADAALLHAPGAVQVFASAAADRTRVTQLETAGARVTQLAAGPDQRLPLPAVLTQLGALGVNELLVECGPTLAGALLEQGLVDECLLYQAMHVLGDCGRPLFHLPEWTSMDQRIGFELLDLRRIGTDVRYRLRPDAQPGDGRATLPVSEHSVLPGE